MQTQINGLNQGVSNANDGVSMIQTASSGLAQITSSLQTIRQLAVQASSGSLSASDQAALQQEVAQQVAEVNRVASQTNYNGKNVLDGSAGNVSFQVGANVGQTISLNLTQSLSAASLGGGTVQKGNTLGTITGLDLTAAGGVPAAGVAGAITSINVLSDGNGGYTFTDQNNQAISTATSSALFTTNTAGQLVVNSATATNPLTTANAVSSISTNNTITATAGETLGTISNISIDPSTGAASTAASAITSITVKSDGNAGLQFFDQNGNQLANNSAAITSNFTVGTAVPGTTASTLALKTVGSAPSTLGNAGTGGTGTTGGVLSTVASNNAPPAISAVDVSTTAGANAAMESIDNALATVNNIQATLGAAQNRFTSISSAQQSQSTDLSGAQSQITDADFAAETANLSKAQVLQQAGISVLAQANSNPQQVLKLLQ
jgi:flagellin